MPTTEAMLAEWEGKVARREKVVLHPAAVERFLRDLKGTLALENFGNSGAGSPALFERRARLRVA